MQELRWFVKEDGTKVLQVEKKGPYNKGIFEDVPVKYNGLLAEYNETARHKVLGSDIEIISYEVGDLRTFRYRHFPTGCLIGSGPIRGSFQE